MWEERLCFDKSLGEYTQWNANGVEVYAQAASVTKGETKIESVIQDVRNLGVIFNVQDKADSYADELQKKYDSVLTSVGNTGTDKKNALVMCAFDGNTFGTYKSSLQENMLNKLGYTNVSTGTSGLSLETLVTMNPELIVYVTSDRNAKNDADAVNKLLSSDAVSDVTAIKNKKIVTIGYDEFMDYGPAVFDALSKIADSVK